jgi:tetratricopeptide (TPR) repeat protein
MYRTSASGSEAMPLSPGDRLGPYEILSTLGAGGMGVVYRARHTLLRREAAIKVLPDRLADDLQALARFEREAQATAALCHPSILAIHDFGLQGGVRFAVTELLEGDTLRALLDRGPLGWRRAAEIACEVAEGLAAAHAKGVIHRDLKPENLFITMEGRAKILDFGLARVKPMLASGGSSAPTRILETQPGTVMGTVAYMSPEQVKGGIADAPSDIFSLGAVLAEMLVGRSPFLRSSAAETMAAILYEQPALPDSMPESLRSIVARCMTKAPEARIAAARDLAREVRALLRGSESVALTAGASVDAGALSQAGRSRSPAYESYLRGRHHWARRNAEGLRKAIGFFDSAIEQDPGYAPAYAGLADCYLVLAWYRFAAPPGLLPKAKSLAQRALDIDPGLAEAWTTLAFAGCLYDWTWQPGLDLFARALAIDPQYITAHQWLGLALAALGREQEAIASAKRALSLDALAVIPMVTLGWVYHFARDYEMALAHYRRALEVAPGLKQTHWLKGLAYEQMGRIEKAIESFERAGSVPGEINASALAHAYARFGRAEDARRLLSGLEEQSRLGYVSEWDFALVHAGLGETGTALDCLERAAGERACWLIFAGVEPRFDGLRGEPRFMGLLQKMGLTESPET